MKKVKPFRNFGEAVVLNVETTGFDPKVDRVVALAVIRARFAELKEQPKDLYGETVDLVVNPQRSISAEASRVHGITDKYVADKNPFADSALKLRNFIGGSPIIAHNIDFNKRFLSNEFQLAGVSSLAQNKGHCIMRRFREFSDRRCEDNLNDMAREMGVHGRAGAKRDVVEDAKIIFEIAALFYMMDNKIRME